MKTRPAIFVNLTTAAAVAAATIFSGTGPAQAKDDDILKILAGVAAAAVIANVITQNQRAARVTRNTTPDPLPRPKPTQAEDYWRYLDPVQPVRNTRGPRLPAACALEFAGGPLPATYYAESCLRREGVTYALPQYCAQQIRSRDWQGRVYEAECLRDAGYRTDRWAE